MKQTVSMPKLSSQMQAGVLVRQCKEVGQPVKAGEVLFEVESDKVVSEIEAPADGVLKAIFFEEGDTVAVGAALAELDA